MPVDPIIERAIRLAYRNGHGSLSSKSVAEVRAYYKQRMHLACVETFESIDLPNQVRIHFFKSKENQTKRPLLIYLRASAYILGSIEDAHPMCDALMRATGCHVAAIEPRLAPEMGFPDGFTDCVTAIRYLYESAAQYDIDVDRIALWGESSGGNMAAALSHMLNQEAQFIKLQILFYPMVDYSKSIHYPSKATYGRGYMMDNDLTDWFLDHYAPTSRVNRHDIRISPLLADSVQHLPKTLIIAAECDPMRDEAIAYYEKLNASGVNVQIVIFPGMTHGFLWYAQTHRHQTAIYAIRLGVEKIKEQLA